MALRIHRKNIPKKMHALVLGMMVFLIATIINIGDYESHDKKMMPAAVQQVAGVASDDSDHATGVIYRGSPRQEAYTYTHPTASYSVEIPPNWLLGFTGTPYNAHLATVLHSPDYVAYPENERSRNIYKGSEIFIYVEAPRAKTPTIEAEYQYLVQLGEVVEGSRKDITIDSLPAIFYIRDMGEGWDPVQTTMVMKDNRIYRFIYRVAFTEGNTNEAFGVHQHVYDTILATSVLPLQAPTAKYEYL